MLKKNIKFIISIIIIVITIVFIYKKNQPKKSESKILVHSQIRELHNLNIVKERIVNKETFILYIGHSLCGDCHDFDNNIFPIILKQHKDIKVDFIDYFKKNQFKEKWDKIIGPKNNLEDSKAIASPIIPNFTFYFTPTLLFLKDGVVEFIWSDFGGGPKRESRYFRNDDSKKEQGFENAKIDLLEIINKWK